MKRLIFLLFVLFLGTLGVYMIEGIMGDNIAGGLFLGAILAVPIFALLDAFELAPSKKDTPTPNINKANNDDDPIHWLVPLGAIIGASAYALFEINPFYFMFGVSLIYPFYCEFSNKD
ncbi:hypothetical protein FFA43_01410 [Campylobacter hyointestinalis subsp. hyointestinalis]|uniref:hypothetical protein n=1 Tax=Campylobacter hyointestinalis TaxID=198 RepID=UPI0010FF863F|nr:hypothetical protein [Campylobacter hyointestinalis]QCT99373.1 hypothetical protein FFA43_01410 [Campylobacter hyointestinalis subsp. hyointestinalis]